MDILSSSDVCLQPSGRVRAGGECPFFARASLPPGMSTNQCVCVTHRMRKAKCRCGSIPPCPFTDELGRVYGDPCQGRTCWSHSTENFPFASSNLHVLFLRTLRKPSTPTLLTSTFVFRSGAFLFGGFELEWSSVASHWRLPWKDFSVTSYGTRGPFKGIEEIHGAPPGTKNQGGHIKSGP